MKKKILSIFLCLAFILVGSTILVACGDDGLFVNFIVDGEVYEKVKTDGEEAISLPQDPTKDGYTFEGWYFDDQTWQNAFTADTLLTSPITETTNVYAHFTLNTYSIVCIDDSATTSYYTVESDDITLPTPTKDDYVFAGWFDNANLTGEAITTVPKGSTGNKIFYAKWEIAEYGINYVLYDGVNNDENPEYYTVESGDITLATPTKENYTFMGWFTSDDFSGSAVTTISSGSSGDKTFYAKWEATEFSVDYVLFDGENNEANPTTYTVESRDVELLNATKTDYTFIGWFTTYEDGVYSDQITSLYSCASDLTLYAKFEYGTEGLTYSCDYTANTAEVMGYEGTATSVVIPTSITRNNRLIAVTAISTSAFSSNTTIKEITLSSGITTIGRRAFSECESLETVTLSSGITVVGDYAFEKCGKLSSVVIPSSVTSIGEFAFFNCTSLQSVTISSGVQSIGNDAFFACESLNSITIPSSVTAIGEGAFVCCYNLGSIIVASDNQNYQSIEENLYSKDGTTLIQYAVGKTDTSFIVPSGVITVEEYAFYHAENLTTVTISEGVETVGFAAFGFCSALTVVTISGSTNGTSVGTSAFGYCSNLESITIGTGVTSFGTNVFSDYLPLGYVDNLSIFYKGTETQWNSITIDSSNEGCFAAATVYYYSATQPEEDGNYWHYDSNGDIEIWSQV